MEALERAMMLDARGELAAAEAQYRAGYNDVVGALATERDPGARRRLVEGGLRHFMVRADEIRAFLAVQSEAGGACEGSAAEAGRPSALTIVGLSRGWEQVGAPSQERRWRSLFGLSDARAFVREQVILGCRFPELMSERRSRGRPRDFKGALLHGPRGVGKSLLLQGLAELLAPLAPRCRVWQLRIGELVSQEGGEERLRTVFSEAVARRDAGELQSVLLLDDLDLVNGGEEERGRPVGTQRGGRKLRLDPAVASRVKEELMLAMRHVAREYDGLFVIAATDRPWAIDAALRRRFDCRIFCAPLDRGERRELLRREVGGTAGEDAFLAVEAQGLARTEGLTTDVICAALLRAQRRPALRAQRARAFYAAPRGRDSPDGLEPDGLEQHAREQHVREQHGRGPRLVPEGELELCDDSSRSDDNGGDGPPRRAASTPAPLLVARLTDVPCDRLDIAAPSAADFLAEIEALPAATLTTHDLERYTGAFQT